MRPANITSSGAKIPSPQQHQQRNMISVRPMINTNVGNMASSYSNSSNKGVVGGMRMNNNTSGQTLPAVPPSPSSHAMKITALNPSAPKIPPVSTSPQKQQTAMKPMLSSIQEATIARSSGMAIRAGGAVVGQGGFDQRGSGNGGVQDLGSVSLQRRNVGMGVETSSSSSNFNSPSSSSSSTLTPGSPSLLLRKPQQQQQQPVVSSNSSITSPSLTSVSITSPSLSPSPVIHPIVPSVSSTSTAPTPVHPRQMLPPRQARPPMLREGGGIVHPQAVGGLGGGGSISSSVTSPSPSFVSSSSSSSSSSSVTLTASPSLPVTLPTLPAPSFATSTSSSSRLPSGTPKLPLSSHKAPSPSTFVKQPPQLQRNPQLQGRTAGPPPPISPRSPKILVPTPLSSASVSLSASSSLSSSLSSSSSSSLSLASSLLHQDDGMDEFLLNMSISIPSQDTSLETFPTAPTLPLVLQPPSSSVSPVTPSLQATTPSIPKTAFGGAAILQRPALATATATTTTPAPAPATAPAPALAPALAPAPLASTGVSPKLPASASGKRAVAGEVMGGGELQQQLQQQKQLVLELQQQLQQQQQQITLQQQQQQQQQQQLQQQQRLVQEQQQQLQQREREIQQQKEQQQQREIQQQQQQQPQQREQQREVQQAQSPPVKRKVSRAGTEDSKAGIAPSSTSPSISAGSKRRREDEDLRLSISDTRNSFHFPSSCTSVTTPTSATTSSSCSSPSFFIPRSHISESEEKKEVLKKLLQPGSGGVLAIIQSNSNQGVGIVGGATTSLEETEVLRKLSVDLCQCMSIIVDGDVCRSLLLVLENFLDSPVAFKPSCLEVLNYALDVILVLLTSCSDCRRAALDLDQLNRTTSSPLHSLIPPGITPRSLSRSSSRELHDTISPHPYFRNPRIVTQSLPQPPPPPTTTSNSSLGMANSLPIARGIGDSSTYSSTSTSSSSSSSFGPPAKIRVVEKRSRLFSILLRRFNGFFSCKQEVLEKVVSIFITLSLDCPLDSLELRFGELIAHRDFNSLFDSSMELQVKCLTVELLTELVQDHNLLVRVQQQRLLETACKYLSHSFGGAERDKVRSMRFKVICLLSTIQAVHRDALSFLIPDKSPETAKKLISRMFVLMSSELDDISLEKSLPLLSSTLFLLASVSQDLPPEIRVARHEATSVWVRLEACRETGNAALQDVADAAEYLRKNLPLA